MNQTNLEILTNIIGAVESGGQIYGKRDYGAYAKKGENSSEEKTCTLGWAQNYGNEGRTLCQMIFDKDPSAFRKVDTANIEKRLKQNWESIGWNPSNSEKKALIAIITTDAGKECQDELFQKLMNDYIANATEFGVTDDKAQMMWCEIEHLGGLSPVKRIFKRANKPYTPETIYESLVEDQNDSTNLNQVGDAKFQTRHECCIKWINQYVKETKVETVSLWTKTAQLLDGQLGYLEKASESNLDSKKANAGYNNYTKYARDVNNWNQPGCQGQAWCAVYQFWIEVNIFGLSKALKHMGGGFYNCGSITNHAKSNGTWHSSPQLGALVIFRNGAHVARVTDISNGKIHTNEGNTSDTEGVVPNGGAVCAKSYTIGSSSIDGYVWIDYGEESETVSTTTSGGLNKTPKWVGKVNVRTSLNVRSWAGLEYPCIKKYPLLKKGNLIDVCDTVKDSEGNSWYYVRIASKYYGFVSSNYIVRV